MKRRISAVAAALLLAGEAGSTGPVRAAKGGSEAPGPDGSAGTGAPAPDSAGSLRSSLSLGSALRRDALPPSSSSAPPADALTAEEVRRAEKEWLTVLELGRLKGGTEEREVMAKWATDGTAPFVRALAETFLEEWRLKTGDPRLQKPRRVFVEPLPILKFAGAVRRIEGISEVDREGRVRSVRMDGTTGSGEADFEIEKWARSARYRPGLEGYAFVSGRMDWRLGG